jgi:hypothetical protein
MSLIRGDFPYFHQRPMRLLLLHITIQIKINDRNKHQEVIITCAERPCTSRCPQLPARPQRALTVRSPTMHDMHHTKVAATDDAALCELSCSNTCTAAVMTQHYMCSQQQLRIPMRVHT